MGLRNPNKQTNKQTLVGKPQLYHLVIQKLILMIVFITSKRRLRLDSLLWVLFALSAAAVQLPVSSKLKSVELQECSILSYHMLRYY